MRIRTIKPEILTDPKSVRLTDTAWRLWVSCWLIADDTGQFPADPMILTGQLFPGRAVADVHGALTELSNTGLVRLYEVNGDRYGMVPHWSRHQKINRPSGPKFPPPSDGFTECSVKVQGVLYADHDHDHDHDHDRSSVPDPGTDGATSPKRWTGERVRAANDIQETMVARFGPGADDVLELCARIAESRKTGVSEKLLRDFTASLGELDVESPAFRYGVKQIVELDDGFEYGGRPSRIVNYVKQCMRSYRDESSAPNGRSRSSESTGALLDRMLAEAEARERNGNPND